jgi:hypothetical protein
MKKRNRKEKDGLNIFPIDKIISIFQKEQLFFKHSYW